MQNAVSQRRKQPQAYTEHTDGVESSSLWVATGDRGRVAAGPPGRPCSVCVSLRLIFPGGVARTAPHSRA
jgi:hypothetical protein